ncbi:APC family permease [Mesorhizobium shangrilense]|uniref:APC family permease n=1 Tax=Mesorhizobium shangrilense TaxID=460060 RepID=A0ABV2DGT4_9HYPH
MSNPDYAENAVSRPVGFWEAVAQSAALVSPAVGVTAGNIYVAQYAGFASPLAFVSAFIICVAIAIVIRGYASRITTAGSFYIYLTQTFGPVAGFISGAMQLGAYLILLIFQPLFFAIFMTGTFPALGGHWGLWACAICAFSVALTVSGVKPSLRAGLVLLAIEVTAFMVLAVAILVKSGANGLSIAPFLPSSSVQGLSGLLLGNVFTIFAFVGFESATTLSGEVRNPARTIPFAVMATTIALGAFFVLVTYCEVIGFGMTDAGLKELTTNPSPFAELALRFGGPWLQVLIVSATGFSLLALNLVTFSAASRLISALGRDGYAPRWLAQLNKAEAPGNAAVSLGVAAAIICFLLGAAYSPENVAGWTSFLATLFFIICYAMLIFGLPIFIRRRYPRDFRIVEHGVVPAVAMAGVLLVAYGNVYPFPPAPLGYFVYVAILAVVLAWAFARTIQARNPDRLGKIAKTLAD